MARRLRPSRIENIARRSGFELFSWKSAIGAGVVVLILAAGYVAQISAVSAKGYQIRDLENQIVELKEQEEKIELKVAESQSVRSVDEKVKEMGLVPTAKVEYVMATAPVVAKR